MTMQFGVMLPQGWRMDLNVISNPVEAYEAMTCAAQEAELLGFTSIWLYDHFHTVPTPSQEITFECWASLAAIARDTKYIRIGQMVTCNSYRQPALLAKMASTLDVISHGRLTLGIGAGWHEQEYWAYGYEYPDAPERLRQLHEAVQIILAMWKEQEVVFEGRYYQIRGAINQPKGVQQPHIPLLIGGSGEQVTLKLVAQYADVCNVSGDITKIQRKLAILKHHCERVSRDYNSIKRTAIVDTCAIAPTEEAAIAKLTPHQQRQIESLRSRLLIGPPAMIRQRLAVYEEAGIQELILWFPDATNPEVLRLFAEGCMQ